MINIPQISEYVMQPIISISIHPINAKIMLSEYSLISWTRISGYWERGGVV
jgi:hypothetical protein